MSSTQIPTFAALYMKSNPAIVGTIAKFQEALSITALKPETTQSLSSAIKTFAQYTEISTKPIPHNLVSAFNTILVTPELQSVLSKSAVNQIRSTMFSEDDSFSDSFLKTSAEICNDDFLEEFQRIDTSDEYAVVSDSAVSKIMSLTGLPEEYIESTEDPKFKRIKAVIVQHIIMPLIISILISTPAAIYKVWHDHKVDQETYRFHQHVISEERKRTSELKKQTELIQEAIDSNGSNSK